MRFLRRIVAWLVRWVKRNTPTARAITRRNQTRAPYQICATRYPLLLVHGIFFRDWPLINYWGRIPASLIANGATIFYGGQQSAASVATCGEELANTIERIIAATGAEKVNVIAHSKGGLDVRWAISQLGQDRHVASLTTINTPHHGCNFARKLLEMIPEQVAMRISSAYKGLFSALGDPNPDFLGGVVDLTDTECARLNELMPDREGVLYQSVGSRMASRHASPFPLSLGYSLIWPVEGPNDGLVATRSMVWGNFLGLVEPYGSHGLCHSDMIDMARRDIDGFDVCEYYVQLVANLKARGL